MSGARKKAPQKPVLPVAKATTEVAAAESAYDRALAALEKAQEAFDAAALTRRQARTELTRSIRHGVESAKL